jgi:hypothetical protein
MVAHERQIGAGAMSLYVLDAFIWTLGIRGHIPQSGEFSPVAGRSSVGASAGALMRALAVFVGMVAGVVARRLARHQAAVAAAGAPPRDHPGQNFGTLLNQTMESL